jgi:hypothetical protein
MKIEQEVQNTQSLRTGIRNATLLKDEKFEIKFKK